MNLLKQVVASPGQAHVEANICWLADGNFATTLASWSA